MAIASDSVPSFAQEDNNINSDSVLLPMSEFDKDSICILESKLTEVKKNTSLKKGIDINTIKNGFKNNKANSMSTQSLTDPYEPNDTASTATPISYGQTISANIGNANDQDWYKINLTASEDIDDAVAILLKDIPSGVDYDLYIFDPNFNYAASQNSGNSDEKLYIQVETTGTWYIAVVPYSGYNANSNYKLFVGSAWANSSTGWIKTNMKFTYTRFDVGEFLPFQVLDLINYNVPNTAIVTSMLIDDGEITGNWGNQHKQIYSPQSGKWYSTYLGLMPVQKIGEDRLFVRQQWAITTKVETLFTSSATWTPDIFISYKYIIE